MFTRCKVYKLKPNFWFSRGLYYFCEIKCICWFIEFTFSRMIGSSLETVTYNTVPKTGRLEEKKK